MSADVSSPGAGGLERHSFCPALLDEARTITRALTGALPEAGVVIVDPALRIVSIAGTLLSRRGHSADAAVGRVVADVYPATAQTILAGCAAALTGEDWQGMHVAPQDGHRFSVQASPLRLLDGSVAGAVLVAQDATPRASESAELERRLAQQAAVAELGLRINEGLAGRDLEDRAAELCRRAMGADLTSVIEVEPGCNVAVVRAGSGWSAAAGGVAELPLAPDRLAGYVVRSGEPLLVDDLAADPRCSSPALLAQGMTCGIATPIGSAGAPSGILGAHSRTPRRFSLEDIAFMQSVAALLGGAAERERTTGLLEEAQARFRGAFQHAPIGMALFDTDPGVGAPILMQVNDALCEMLGHDAEELGRIDLLALSHPDDLYIGVAEGLALASGRARSYVVEKRLLRADGSVMHARIRGSIVRETAEGGGYGICQVEDLTETKLLRREEDRIWELSADLLAIVGAEGFVRVSPSWERCLGHAPDELAVLSFDELIHPADRSAATEALARALAAPDVEAHFDCRVRTHRGDWRWLSWSARSAERERDEDPPRVYCIARDMTDRRETERALVESLSLFDQSFENAPVGMAISEPSTGRYLRVNQAFCRLTGRGEDELLSLDSFLDITHPDDQAAGRRYFTEPGMAEATFEVEKRYVRPDGSAVWASLHVTPVRDADGNVTALSLQILDIDEQKGRQADLQRKLDAVGWVGRIRHALEHDRFELHSQPIVDLRTSEVVQRELLIRMRGEDGELVPPGLFLPVAEEHGLIEDIDRWVLSRAVRIAAAGQSVEVNVSAASMSSPDFLIAVERELRASGADPACLVFEITETALMRQMDLGVAFAEHLAGLGCRFALDDFGTGYASFTYLKRLPVHYLKIDREFVRDLVASPQDRHVVQAIVNLADGFDAQTIAEGVEDAVTLELLADFGVDYAQGFHLGRPAPLDR